MPVRREPLLAAVLPTSPRADRSAEREPAPTPNLPRITGARASLADVEAVAAELHERDER